MAAGSLVSVVMPAHQAERWLEQAVTSLLVQSHRELEVIVVDDGSTDRTPDIVASIRDSRLRLVRLERQQGVAAALNAGLAAARGELVGRLDADDYALADRIERQVAALDAHPELALIAGRGHVVDGRRTLGPTPLFRGRALHWALHLWCVVLHPTILVRRSRLPAAGYPSATRFCVDWALFLDLARRERLDMLPAAVTVYRRHPGAIGQAHRAAQDASNRDVLRAHVRATLGLDVRPTSAMTWVRPRYAAQTEDPAELVALAERLDPEALELGPHVPPWSAAELARCRRVYAKRLAEIGWHGRARPDLARALAPLALRAAVRALRLGAAR
ncbi:MAG: glycosyltransferase family 2 protein [Myxococcota bacterium]